MEIAKYLPKYWQGIVSHFSNTVAKFHNELSAHELDVPLDATLCWPITTPTTLPDFKESTQYTQIVSHSPLLLNCPLYYAYDIENTHSNNNTSLPPRLQTRINAATDLEIEETINIITHPAHMMPLMIKDQPTRGITKSYYLRTRQRAVLKAPNTYTPEEEWSKDAPNLTCGPERPHSLQEQVKAAALSMCRGKRNTPLTKTHMWLLWQRRLTPHRFEKCIWCTQKRLNTSHDHFLHEAWTCPVFRTHWNRLRQAARVPNFTSIAEFVLGFSSHKPPEKGVKKDQRRRAVILHAAMFKRGIKGWATNLEWSDKDYQDTLRVYFRNI